MSACFVSFSSCLPAAVSMSVQDHALACPCMLESLRWQLILTFSLRNGACGSQSLRYHEAVLGSARLKMRFTKFRRRILTACSRQAFPQSQQGSSNREVQAHQSSMLATRSWKMLEVGLAYSPEILACTRSRLGSCSSLALRRVSKA